MDEITCTVCDGLIDQEGNCVGCDQPAEDCECETDLGDGPVTPCPVCY